MAESVTERCHSANRDRGVAPFRVLLLGLGGGELATHVVKSCGRPDGTAVQLDAVELDSRLPALASRYFGLPPSIHVTVGDAFPVVKALQKNVEQDALLADQRLYDVLLVDCFSTGGVTPEHCRSGDFVRILRSLLRGGGVVLHHLWHMDEQHPEVAGNFDETVSTYREAFQCKGCAVEVRPLNGPDSLVVASNAQDTG